MSNGKSPTETLSDKGQYPRRKTSVAPLRNPENSIMFPHRSTFPLLETEKEGVRKKEGRKKEEKDAIFNTNYVFDVILTVHRR